MQEQTSYFGKEKISKILLKLAPPVMAAQLIQALYNLIDSLFIGNFSQSGLTALSIVYPLQLLMIALAVGTGVGINTVMSAKNGIGREDEAREYAGVALPLGTALWVIFAAVSWFLMPLYARLNTPTPEIIDDVITYGRIVCVLSPGLFIESVLTKVIQAGGDMKTPTIAQVIGAVINIILDPILIFGLLGFPSLGVAGAAIATVLGQLAAAAIVFKKGFYPSPSIKKYPKYVKKIFRLGLPNMLMQSAYTFYIFGLNLVLSSFGDAAVTVLGLYYKWQSIFFIPLGAMQTCIVPVISYNYAAGKFERCKKTLNLSILFGMVLMLIGIFCFEVFPEPMLKVFSAGEEAVKIGVPAFRIVAVSFIPLVSSLTYPVFFQAVGKSLKSSLLTVIRTVVLFVPLGYLFSRINLNCFWLTFPVTDSLTTLAGFLMYKRFIITPYAPPKNKKHRQDVKSAAIFPSRPGVIVTVARQHGSCGKEIAKRLSELMDVPFYYKELTVLAAEESGLTNSFISDLNVNSPKILHDLYLSKSVVVEAVAAQEKIIKRISENGSCVIVGRAADYVLRENPDLIRVFIYGSKEKRAQSVIKRYGDSREEAEKNIARSDKARAAYYKNISGKNWGEPEQYDVMICSDGGTEKTARALYKAINELKNKTAEG